MALTTSPIPMNPASQAFIHRLMMFSAPKRFKGDSTSFDMGYEQCKRDLRALVTNLVPDAVANEDTNEPTANPVDEAARWWNWFKR